MKKSKRRRVWCFGSQENSNKGTKKQNKTKQKVGNSVSSHNIISKLKIPQFVLYDNVNTCYQKEQMLTLCILDS